MATVAEAAHKDRILASPLARRMAKQAGLDLASLQGSGPHGRIIKRDIEAALGAGRDGAPARQAVATVAGRAFAAVPALSDEKILALYDKGTYEILPHDNMRKVIAERLTIATQTIPHFYLSVDCRLDDLMRARERMNAASPHEGPRAYKLSVNDFIIKAMALALQEVPAANATWTEGGMLRHRYSDVGVAVAVEGGLFTPIIHQ
ncbi:MAG: 2-oxo acid dehydrogenase subunit E2, partial [Hyphomicrobium sp.]